MMRSIKFALFGMLSMCLMMISEDSPAADTSAVTNPVHEGILGRVEAALKSGAVWIEDHLHALLDNIETALAGSMPPVDPTPEQTAAALQADPNVPEMTDVVEAGKATEGESESATANVATQTATGTQDVSTEDEHEADAAPTSSEPTAQ